MTAKTRHLVYRPAVDGLGGCVLPNVLVAGCSYVWNNSEEHVCTWPYYLQSILKLEQVYDCSQSGGGPNLVFHSVINEITINRQIDPSNTLVIVMWPELSRTDVIVDFSDSIAGYHNISLHKFSKKFCNLSIFNKTLDEQNHLAKLAKIYKSTVGLGGQEYESLIKILALASFLTQKGFSWMFMPWKTMNRTRLIDSGIPPSIVCALDCFDDILPLDDYTENTQQRIPHDGHPTPDAHFDWTRQYLLPCLASKWPSLIKIS